MEIRIPFDGFYHSESMDILEWPLERYREEGLDLSDHINWRKAFEEFAEEYTKAFSNLLDIPMTFKELDSPREYNFSTDVIVAEIDLEYVKPIAYRTKKEVFKEILEENLTPRSGFIPFYSNNPDKWTKSLKDWDHNELYMLILAHIRQEEIDLDEIYEVLREKDIALNHLTEEGETIIGNHQNI